MRDNRFLVLLYIIIYLVIVVSCGSVDVNDNRNSRNGTEDTWPRTRVILRSVRSAVGADKKLNKNLDSTFGRNMKEWLYSHDAIVNSSCNFSNSFGRACYIYDCEKGKSLYCEMKLRAGPCPESLKAYENSFHCRDVKISRDKGRLHVCKLGGMVRSLGEGSKLRNGKNMCVYRDVITLSGGIVEELTSRVEGKPWVLRKRRYFRRETEDTTEAKQEDDDNLKKDKDEEDGKTDGTTKNSKEDNDNDSSDKSTTEDNNDDENDTSNSKSTTAASNAGEEEQTAETTEAATEDDVTEKSSDDDVKSKSDDVTDENVTTTTEEEMMSSEKMLETTSSDEVEGTINDTVTEEMVTESEGSEETATSDEGEMTTTSAVTESGESEETGTSDEGEMKTTSAVTESEESEETGTSDEGEMTTTSAVTESEESEETATSDEGEMTTPEPKEVMKISKNTNKGDSRADESSFKHTKSQIYSVLSKLFREHSDFFTFQIKSQIKKRFKEGEIGELLRLKMKALTKNKNLSKGAAMKKLKNEILEHLHSSKIMTVVQNMLDDLGKDLKIGKDGELLR